MLRQMQRMTLAQAHRLSSFEKKFDRKYYAACGYREFNYLLVGCFAE